MSTSLRGAAALAAVLAATSCTASPAAQTAPPSGKASASRSVPQNWSCQEGKFHWGKVVKQETLAAVSDAQKVEIPAGKTAETSLELVPIRSMKATVSPSLPDDAVNPQAAVASLEEETGLELEKVGTSFTLSEGDKIVKTESGKFSGVLVAVVGVKTVEASFVYGCSTPGRESMRGTLTTWSPTTYSGLFKCGIDEELPEVEAEAETLLCGEK
ncbi:hypothetical protein OG548_25890 [Streptomyces sp. NBC_01356]|uniref:hypothetical protein n=1 Tax=Streptomyces sp. NBC_01356 TaxID=2903836 RepID=UPI002E374103|nr:hypothetical protein [Streptomyces sp. NBC_01356]